MMSPDRLSQLRNVATIESIGSSTRIEGVKLSDIQVETLLSNLTTTSFKNRDEQEVAGYAEAMDLVFQAFEGLRLTENHIRQLHQTLLRHSDKDERQHLKLACLPISPPGQIVIFNISIRLKLYFATLIVVNVQPRSR